MQSLKNRINGKLQLSAPKLWHWVSVRWAPPTVIPWNGLPPSVPCGRAWGAQTKFQMSFPIEPGASGLLVRKEGTSCYFFHLISAPFHRLSNPNSPFFFNPPEEAHLSLGQRESPRETTTLGPWRATIRMRVCLTLVMEASQSMRFAPFFCSAPACLSPSPPVPN